MNKTILIVDAYSSGNFLAPEFFRRGFDCVHLQSTPEIFPILKKSFIRDDFVANLAFDGDLDALLRSLKKLNLAAAIPGTETGVHLADSISEALNLKTNGTSKSRARRNKYVMIETLRDAGLNVAQQTKSCHVQDLIAFKEGHNFSKVVVKPVESAGSEDVRICETKEHIIKAHNAIMGKTNMLGLRNDEAIIQEFLSGTEFFINCVSKNGRHVVCDMWRHNKHARNGFDFVYDRAILCDGKSAEEKAIIAYTMRVLDALSIRHGPSHSEIMVTERGPHLVEMGARLQGMSLPKVNDACIGFGPVDLTADCYVDESSFDDKARDYTIQRYAMRVNLISDRKGVLRVFDVDKLKSLKSFFFVRPICEIDTEIPVTINYFTVPGFVMLVSAEKEQLEEDYRMIRSWEQGGQILIYE